jgi:hypothetical protein
MRLATVGNRWTCCWPAAAACLIAGVVLAGCSSPSTSPTTDSWFAGRLTNLFSSEDRAQLPGTPPTQAAPFDQANCPGMDIRTGASTLSIAARGGQPTASDLRYQLSFHQTARKCVAQDGMLIIRVGVQGRVILGPAGGPGQVEVPLRYALVREGVTPRTLATKFKRFAVTVPPGQTNVLFTDVEENLAAPMPSLSDLQASVIYVGFDELGDRGDGRAPAKGAAKKSGSRAN